jgi:serine/threonine protein kinase HipA of HipAB toxin-antitoxin module
MKRAIGNLVSAEAAAHEIDAARCIERDGIAVLTAIEGLASMGSGMAARQTPMVKEKKWPEGKKDLRDCYTCGAIGHVSRDCSKKAE